MVCNRGTNLTQPEASVTATSTASGGIQATEAASGAGASGTSGNGAAPATHTGIAKAAGLLGILLAAWVMGRAL